MALRPGYPMYRPNGEYMGTTREGDRILYPEGIAPGPARLPLPVGIPQEWLAGQLNDAAGPAITRVLVPAAAANPHA